MKDFKSNTKSRLTFKQVKKDQSQPKKKLTCYYNFYKTIVRQWPKHFPFLATELEISSCHPYIV